MPTISPSELPPGTLLGRYAASGDFTDCYVAELPFPISHSQFVYAFYTTPLFRIERGLLRLIARPSTDAQVRLLADGKVSTFAAWSVEARSENQVLLAAGRTRSWLMVVPSSASESSGVRLLFGSAVVPKRGSTSGRRSMGLLFDSLLGFHRLYSRALLASACARLSRQQGRTHA
jgi:hypothetical protein